MLQEALERSRADDAKTRRLALHDLCPCQVKADVPAAWERVLEMTTDHDVSVRKQALHNLRSVRCAS